MLRAGTISDSFKSVFHRIVLATPFIVILVLYETSRAVAFKINPGVTYNLPLSFEEKVFGVPLVIYFQAHRLVVLDFLCSIVYSLHPINLLILLIYFLIFDLDNYKHALISVGTASLIAVFTYIVWPVAPPWIAYPGITRIPNVVFQVLGLERSIDPNPYAAMPSMHVAYAFFFYYYSKKISKNIFDPLRIIGYFMVISMPLSVIYTGNHYLLDVVAGFLVAGISLKIADVVLRKDHSLYQLLIFRKQRG